MGILSNLFSGKKSSGFPFREETSLRGLFLCGQLREIFIGPVKETFCLLFTDGLLKYGQKEICLCLPANQYHPKYRVEWERFMETVCQYAANSRLVQHGDVSVIQQVLFGFANGFIYAEPGPLDRRAIPEDFLMAIAMSRTEAQTLRVCNPARLLAIYGLQKQYFPYPFWSEVSRPPLPVEGMEQSAFTPLYREKFDRAYLTREGDKIILRLPVSASQEQLERLMGKGERPFCMYLMCSLAADSCLVWYPGISEPQAIGMHNSRMERLSLLTLVVIQEDENKGLLVEDGFCLFLRPEVLDAFIQAVYHRQNTDISIQGDFPVFSLIWEPAPQP